MCHNYYYYLMMMTQKQKNEIQEIIIQRARGLSSISTVGTITVIYLYSISEKKYRCIIYMYVRMDFLV